MKEDIPVQQCDICGAPIGACQCGKFKCPVCLSKKHAAGVWYCMA